MVLQVAIQLQVQLTPTDGITSSERVANLGTYQLTQCAHSACTSKSSGTADCALTSSGCNRHMHDMLTVN